MIFSSKQRILPNSLQFRSYPDVDNAFNMSFTAVFIIGKDSNRVKVLEEAVRWR